MDDLLAALNGYQNMAAVAGEPGGVSREKDVTILHVVHLDL